MVFVRYDSYLCDIQLLLLLPLRSLRHQRDRPRFVLSIDSIYCCLTVSCLYTQHARRAYESTHSTVVQLLYERGSRCCAGWQVAEGNIPFSGVCSVFLLFTQKLAQTLEFLMHPWQYCRRNGLELHTRTYALSHSGMRGAAGERQSAAVKPPFQFIYIFTITQSSPGLFPLCAVCGCRVKAKRERWISFLTIVQ